MDFGLHSEAGMSDPQVKRRLERAAEGVESRLSAAGKLETSGRGILPSFSNGPLKLRLFR